MAKAALTSAIVVAATLALAVVLNPSPDRHRAKIKAAVAERSQLAGMLGLGSLAAFVSEYHSLGVASYTKVGERTASWGAFGMVFVAQPVADK